MQISKSTVNIDEQYSIFLTIQRSIKWNLGLFGVLSMYTHESPLLHPHLLTACDPEQWDRQALNEKEELQRETWIKPIYSFVFVHLFSSFTWNILSSPPLASLVTQFKTSGGGIQTCMHRSTNALTAGWAMMEDRRGTKTSTISTKLWKQPLNSLSASNGDQKRQRLH